MNKLIIHTTSYILFYFIGEVRCTFIREGTRQQKQFSPKITKLSEIKSVLLSKVYFFNYI